MKKLCLPCSLSPPLPPPAPLRLIKPTSRRLSSITESARRWRGSWPLPPFPPQLPPHRPVLFSATVATDTPAETINKLTALIPAGRAKHYEVHVEVVPVGEGTDRQ